MMKIKSKRHKRVFRERKIKFQDHKNCLEASQIGNKTNDLEKNETDRDSLEDQKEFKQNNELILKT